MSEALDSIPNTTHTQNKLDTFDKVQTENGNSFWKISLKQEQAFFFQCSYDFQTVFKIGSHMSQNFFLASVMFTSSTESL
jgi:hypothetical protein